MKFRSVGAELLHVNGRTDERRDRQTDRHDALRNFANMTKNENTKEILILLLIVISTVCMEYF